MFDLRLGLALGKSLGEIRTLPYREYQKWQLFYLLEPWGFHDREYRTAAILAQLHNVNTTKKRQAKQPVSYMRDMLKKVLEAIRNKMKKDEASTKHDLSTEEGRKAASEDVIKMFQSIFGKRMERKDK